MKTDFKNKWAIILGGSSGLGLASAKKLASEGLNICIVHRDRKSNLPNFEAEVVAMQSFGVHVKTFNKDALTNETRAEVLSCLPKNSVKILLHSIAKGTVKPMHAKDGDILSKEDFTITLQAMALSLYDWSIATIDSDLFSDKARILAFTSEGNTKAWQYYGAVSAAKSTLEALMRNMALEFAPLGITTNCVQAGVTQTPSFKMIPGSEELAKIAKKRNPFDRLTTPNDVANVVFLLCSSEANWINGTVIKADGGESLQ